MMLVFQERADISSCPAEQSYLYKLAYDCLVKNHGSDESEDTGKQSDVFTLLWKSRIQEYIHQQQQTEVYILSMEYAVLLFVKFPNWKTSN